MLYFEGFDIRTLGGSYHTQTVTTDHPNWSLDKLTPLHENDCDEQQRIGVPFYGTCTQKKSCLLCTLRFKYKLRNISLINLLVPTERTAASERDTLYETMKRTFSLPQIISISYWEILTIKIEQARAETYREFRRAEKRLKKAGKRSLRKPPGLSLKIQ